MTEVSFDAYQPEKIGLGEELCISKCYWRALAGCAP